MPPVASPGCTGSEGHRVTRTAGGLNGCGGCAQASLMEGMQGLYDDMRRDIAEVRRELHEVRQAQKHLRHARSGAM